LISAAAVLAIGLYLSVSVDLSVSAVVVAELERLSGVLNPDSHQAGVTISDAWGKLAAIAVNGVAMLTALFGLRSNQQRAEREEGESANDDNRSLWDEQN
jgi:hypothetical protein